MAIIEKEEQVFRISALKKVEYVELYEMTRDELIMELVEEHDFNEEEVLKYSDEELDEIFIKLCEEQEIEGYISKNPSSECDMEIKVEDEYHTTLTAITDTETNTTTYEDRGL